MLLLYQNHKRAGTSFQSSQQRQKQVGNVCHKLHNYLTIFHSDTTCDSEETNEKVTSNVQRSLW